MELERVAEPTPTHPNSIGCWRGQVARAYSRAGMTQKVAAAELGISPQALSKQLAGAEHLSFWRMFALPREFWQEMVVLIIEFYGLKVPGMSEQDLKDLEFGRSMREAFERVRLVR